MSVIDALSHTVAIMAYAHSTQLQSVIIGYVKMLVKLKAYMHAISWSRHTTCASGCNNVPSGSRLSLATHNVSDVQGLLTAFASYHRLERLAADWARQGTTHR